jgi:hypothetical protein
MTVQTEGSNRRMETAADAGSMTFVYLVSLVAAVGGLILGFDTAVISGAIGFKKAQFRLDATREGFVASSALSIATAIPFLSGSTAFSSSGMSFLRQKGGPSRRSRKAGLPEAGGVP